MAIEYRGTSTLPNPELTWNDSDGAVRDLSTGWTFEVLVGAPGEEALTVKTSGLTGSDSAPNFVIEWDDEDLAPLPLGQSTVECIATNIATGQEIWRSFEITKVTAVQRPVP